MKLVDFLILNHTCIPGPWSLGILFLICCYVSPAHILLKLFASTSQGKSGVLSPSVTGLSWHQEGKEKLCSFCSRTIYTAHELSVPWRYKRTPQGKHTFWDGGGGVLLWQYFNFLLSLTAFSSWGTASKGSIVLQCRCSYNPPQLCCR